MYHYYLHSKWGTFNVDNLSFNVIIIQIFGLFGKLSCHIFMIITGYFMIKSKANYKKIVLLILEMMFYSIGIMLIFYGFGIAEFSIKNFIKSLLPTFCGNWFLVNYILFYFFIPYLNEFINKLEQKTFKKLVILSIIVYSVIPTLTNNSWNLSNLDNFIVMYFVGAYIRLYIDCNTNKKFNIIGMIVSIILLISSVLCFDFIGKVFNLNYFVNKATYFGNPYSILSVSAAIFMFLVFKDINFNSKIVNWISSSVLGIYLIHDNELFVNGWLWSTLFHNADTINSKYLFIYAIVEVILVFVVCLIIDKLRIYILEKPIKKWLDKKWPMFEEKYERCKEKLHKRFIFKNKTIV
jgi:surface polysaccharide O-acyltransferase-like enzyme